MDHFAGLKRVSAFCMTRATSEFPHFFVTKMYGTLTEHQDRAGAPESEPARRRERTMTQTTGRRHLNIPDAKLHSTSAVV
jgi:hypothetical protein